MTAARLLRLHTGPAPTEQASAIAAAVFNSCKGGGPPLTVGNYRKLKTVRVVATGNPLRFTDVVRHIRETRGFDHARFGLPQLLSPLLDSSLWAAWDGPTFNADDPGYYVPLDLETPMGRTFPAPSIDREGAAYSSFQFFLQRNIVRLYHHCVETENPLDLNGDWLSAFRALINECVSIVDMTLHQLYYLAKHRGPELGFSFDESSLPSREGRLMDKLRWVGLICGTPLDAQKEERKFDVLRRLRNQLNHFDPPAFAFHLEELVGWLNLVPAVGRLLWKIRDRMGTALTAELIQIILLPPVIFEPKDPTAPRASKTRGSGYADWMARLSDTKL